MKKILSFILLLSIVYLFGCTKILNTSPYNSITDVSAFESADRCALTMNGIYDAAQSTYYVGGNTDKRGYPFGAANIEQNDAMGEDVVNIATFYQITYEATYNSNAANCVGLWKGLYILINDANLGIVGFSNAATAGIIPQTLSNQYQAECRFLRAMAHHEVLIHWAKPYADGKGVQVGIPWREIPINSTASVNEILNTPRMRVDSVYAKILADLDFAETNLPATIISGVSYRATKAAAIALKMRVKLHMGDWAGVIAEGAKLVPGAVTPSDPSGTICPIGGWALTVKPDGPFTNNNSTESMFSIKNDPLDGGSVNGGLAAMYGSADLKGRGLISISPIIWNNPGWLCDDVRRTLLTTSGSNATGKKSYFTTKYSDYITRGDYSPQIRYAEVLLTLAEAVARSSSDVSQRAIDLLNLVRNRSLALPATEQYTIASFTSNTDLVKAILLERRIEFLCEGKRWPDIHRLAPDPDFTTNGIPAKAKTGTAGLGIYVCGSGYTPGLSAITYTDYRFLWPIPASEIVSNPIIAQNPDY